jgi:hypothetical protein
MFPSDLAELSLDDVVERARDVSSQISQLQARHVELVAEIDRRSGTYDGTPAAFVAWQCGLQPGEARRALALARKLPKVPAIAGAFADGELSEATVRLLATVATPDNETELLDLTETATASQLRTLVNRYRRVRPDPTPEQEASAADPDRASDLGVGWDDEGRLALRGDLAAGDGLDFEQALRLAGEQNRADQRADDNESGTDTLSGLLPDEVAARDRAAALLRMVRAFLGANTTQAGLLPDGHHTLVVTTAAALAVQTAARSGNEGANGDGNAPVDPGGDPTYRPGGPTVPAWLAAARACHGSVSALVVHHGHPATATIDARFATPAQKRALLVRDGCCAFPGCGLTVGLIAHHIVEHDDGGPTRLDNLVLLCAQHHNLIHRKHYTIDTDIAVDGPGRFTFTRHDGTPVPAVNPRPPPSKTAAPPPPRPRPIGLHEPLTHFAADNILHHWLTHDERVATAERVSASPPRQQTL